MNHTPVCNLNCICTNSDCQFSHFLNPKERRDVKKLFDCLVRPSKVEDNGDKRKANCRFGQLCYVKDCGFRHRLSFNDRLKLVENFNKFKLSDIKVEKKAKEINVKCFDISSKNAFDILEDIVDVPDEVPNDTALEVINKPIENGKRWADLFDNEDDFYMKF